MSLFDFGKRQRMHVQMHGSTNGREMFKVGEYEQRKNKTMAITIINFVVLTSFYFYWKFIPSKTFIFLFICLAISWIYGYHNFQQQKRLRENLY